MCGLSDRCVVYLIHVWFIWSMCGLSDPCVIYLIHVWFIWSIIITKTSAPQILLTTQSSIKSLLQCVSDTVKHDLNVAINNKWSSVPCTLFHIYGRIVGDLNGTNKLVEWQHISCGILTLIHFLWHFSPTGELEHVGDLQWTGAWSSQL